MKSYLFNKKLQSANFLSSNAKSFLSLMYRKYKHCTQSNATYTNIIVSWNISMLSIKTIFVWTSTLTYSFLFHIKATVLVVPIIIWDRFCFFQILTRITVLWKDSGRYTKPRRFKIYWCIYNFNNFFLYSSMYMRVSCLIYLAFYIYIDRY